MVAGENKEKKNNGHHEEDSLAEEGRLVERMMCLKKFHEYENGKFKQI